MLEKTQAVIIPGAMCAWGLQPSDAPSQHVFYRKGYWLVASANLAPFLIGLGRPCPGLADTHQHTELRGNVLAPAPSAPGRRRSTPSGSPRRSPPPCTRPPKNHPPIPSGGAQPRNAVNSKGKRTRRSPRQPGPRQKHGPPPQRAAGHVGSTASPEGTLGGEGLRKVDEWAQALCTHCSEHSKYTPEAMKEGARLGDGLIRAVGDWKGAAGKYREAWKSRRGNNLSGSSRRSSANYWAPTSATICVRW